jgi:hypothetical protein
MKDKLKQAVTDVLNSQGAFEKCNDVKPKELYVVLVNGKRVRMRSGKMVWNGKGPAKTALRNHMHNLEWRNKTINNLKMIDLNNGNIDYMATREAIKEAEDEWIEKHVVFMPFADYMLIQRKRNIENKEK